MITGFNYENGNPISGGDFIEFTIDGKSAKGVVTRNLKQEWVVLSLSKVFKLTDCTNIKSF